MYKREVWPNGVRVLYVPTKNTKTVAVYAMVSVGSRYETKDISGISHFLEHMAFKGTKKRPNQKAIAQELDSIGASYNAYTSRETTAYYVKTSKKHLELAVDVVADIFLNSTIPAEEIEKERGVILGELDMVEDSPMNKVGYNFEELLYGNQPMGWHIIGTKKTIKSVKREDFIAYRNEHYRTRNMVIVVAGNLNIPKTRKLLKKHFTGIKKGRLTKPIPVKERQSKPQIKIINKKTDQTHLVLGTRTRFNMSDKRQWPLSILSVILGGNMSSRLFIKMRDELGLGYYVRTDDYLGPDSGYFEVSAGVDTKRFKQAVEVIMEELRDVSQNGVTKEELKKAKDFISGSSVMGLESANSLASFFGGQEIFNQKILTLEQKLRIIKKVTLDEVKNVAKDIFKNKNLNLAAIGPIKKDSQLEKILTF